MTRSLLCTTNPLRRLLSAACERSVPSRLSPQPCPSRLVISLAKTIALGCHTTHI